LENYEKTLGEMSPETFCGNADALLDIRDRFLKNPSYINYFLVDSINRVIYVNLGERLAKVGDVPVCYDKIVGRLAEFRCDWSRMFEFTSREYDSDKMPVPEFKNLSFENKIDVIGKMVGQEQTFFFLPQDFYNVFGLRILEKRSLTALLSRLAVSDHTIGASLPALLSYRRRVTHFDPTDITSQLRDIFKDHPRLHPTLLYYDPPPVASVVKKIVEHIRSENWRQQLGFSDPPEFTKERIKRWEQEEAEREAQREAK